METATSKANTDGRGNAGGGPAAVLRALHLRLSRPGMFGTGRRTTAAGAAVKCLLFLLFIFLFLTAVLQLGRSGDARQKETLENALSRAVTAIFAEEGRYPDSLEDLTARYPLLCDEDRFRIDYRALGANIRPEVTVLERNGN